MSGFWARMGGRGSSNTNLAPPSGRSSTSSRELQRDREGDASIDPEMNGDEDMEDQGCIKLSKVRLPASLRKLRPSSLPKAPTPNSNPDPNAKPPTPSGGRSSSRKILGKRAASSSPSRKDKKSFRAISTDRFVAQMPDQLKSVFKRRLSNKENISTGADKLPPKPCRRPGPVGKSWVRAYDDIIYMDLVKTEDEPILGYTGFPTKVPEAFPLPLEPIPPTPPPKRAATLPRPNKPRPVSVESEYDNVVSKKYNEVITTVTVDVKKEVEGISVENVEQKRKKSNKGRGRDANRFKGRRNKRMDTPVRSEGLGFDDDDMSEDSIEREVRQNVEDLAPVKPVRGNKIYETINDTQVVEIEEKPAKPARGNKIYDTVEDVKKTEVMKEREVQQDDMSEISEPPRPRRGIKIYETIEIKREPIDGVAVKKEIDLEVSETQEEVKEEEEVQNDKLEEEPTPAKPKRGIKLYETITFEKTKDDVERYFEILDEKNGSETVTQEDVVVTQEPQEQESVPPKPARGNKIYVGVIFKQGEAPQLAEIKKEENEKTIVDKKYEKERVSEIKTEISGGRQSEIEEQIITCSAEVDEQKEPSQVKEMEEMKFVDSSSVETVLEDTNAIAPYATVWKDARTNEMHQLLDGNADAENDSVPPPIPPKKKNIKTIDHVRTEDVLYDIVPPRPPRHLKPITKPGSRTRSLDPSPCRPKRQRVISSTTRGGTKIYTGIHFDAGKPSEVTVNTAMMNGDLTQENVSAALASLPGKPSRRRLPAPPRKKRHAQGSPLTVRLTLDPEKGPTVTSSHIEDQNENYENIDISTTIKTENGSVPPQMVTGSTADTTKQNSLPKRTENKVIENEIGQSSESDACQKIRA